MPACLLLNTIYFHNKWKTALKGQNWAEFPFGKRCRQRAVRRHSIAAKSDATLVRGVAEDYFENNASVTYILPDEGVDVTAS